MVGIDKLKPLHKCRQCVNHPSLTGSGEGVCSSVERETMDHQVRELFSNHDVEGQDLVSAVDLLVRQRGNGVYREVFRYLFRKEVDERRAARYWREAIARWQSQSKRKSGLQDVRGALLDYLHNVAGERLSSIVDGLTGLYNQAYFKAHLENILAYKRRNDRTTPLALILFDFDQACFPPELRCSIFGDRILRRTADLIRFHIRSMDVPAHFDGGEFALLLPDTGRPQALRVVERLRSAIEKATFDIESAFPIGPLTLSCGLVAYPENEETASSLLREAKRELNEARKSGNTVSPSVSDRRKDERKKVRSLVELCTDGEQYSPAMTIDISRRGVGLGCDMEMSTGSTIEVRFRQPYWPMTRHVAGTVRRVFREKGGGITRIGLEFDTSEVELYDVAPSAYFDAPPLPSNLSF